MGRPSIYNRYLMQAIKIKRREVDFLLLDAIDKIYEELNNSKNK